ncbi:hypothetical protein YQE_01365, partial [Dendroctonus ponderosae]
MGRKVTIASATLNQWALDFEGNLDRILQSIMDAKEMGATFRTGPELEIWLLSERRIWMLNGYNCQDHFYESDTYLHSWEVLAELLSAPLCKDMLIDVGIPVMHKNAAYNCRLVFLNKSILLIRPKKVLAGEGNYREHRWFSTWKTTDISYNWPAVPFGDAVISTLDTCIGFEICEELWCSASQHIPLSLDGVEIICNGSGSHTQLRKNYILTDLVENATMKCGGCYVFSNLRGCDGERVYFDGTSSITLNGAIISRTKQFALDEVVADQPISIGQEVIAATIDLEDIRCYRYSKRSLSDLASGSQSYPRIAVDFLLSQDFDAILPTVHPISFTTLTPEEEIVQGPACWLWDYLRRSGQGGLFLPLSGGIDSSSTATIVYSMCRMIVDNIQRIGEKSYHQNIVIDKAVSACLEIFSVITGLFPKFAANGGCARQNMALQNIQARVRMVAILQFVMNKSIW